MATKATHHNEPRTRLGRNARELLTGKLTQENYKERLRRTAARYKRAIAAIGELENTALVRPWLTEDFGHVRPNGSSYHSRPSLQETIELQNTCQGLLEVFGRFPIIAEDLKYDAGLREEYLEEVWPSLEELSRYSRFQPLLVPCDLTGQHDYEIGVIINLCGLNDLVEYSIVLMASNPKTFRELVGSCARCHRYFIRGRTDQQKCSPTCCGPGDVEEEYDEEEGDEEVRSTAGTLVVMH